LIGRAGQSLGPFTASIRHGYSSIESQTCTESADAEADAEFALDMDAEDGVDVDGRMGAAANEPSGGFERRSKSPGLLGLNVAPTEAPAELWARWRGERDARARDALIRHYLPYARMVAATVYARRSHDEIEFDDYLQLACVGMVESVDRFDPVHGAQFRTFAAKRVRGAILNGLVRLSEKNQQISVMAKLRAERLEAVKEGARAQVGAQPRSGAGASGEPLFRYLAEVGIGIALVVLLEDTGMIEPEEPEAHAQAISPEISYFQKSEMSQLRRALNDKVDQLPASERLVIRRHYLEQIPFEEIARGMALTRGRISQLHRQALLRLRDLLADDARCDVSF
jgi:RNA polymerase sigma factor for flagellar operon FliA